MSSKKKSVLRTVFTSNGSCGCGKTKVSEVHEPIPKPKFSSIHHQNKNPCSRMSSSTTTQTSTEDEEYTSTTISEPDTTTTTTTTTTHLDHNNNNNNNVVLVPKRSPLIDSFAIEKNSSDPYHDFRHSMLQMIFEKEIDSEEDLQDLLHCFLELNAPRHHHVIVKAFNEICEEAFSFSDKVTTTTTETEPSTSRKNHDVIVPKSTQ